MILEGMVEGKRRRGRPEKQWVDNIKESTMLELGEMMQKARDRKKWRVIMRKPSLHPYGRETWVNDDDVMTPTVFSLFLG